MPTFLSTTGRYGLTPAQQAQLDNLDAPISGIQGGLQSAVKSVQRGTNTVSKSSGRNLSISTVDPNKCSVTLYVANSGAYVGWLSSNTLRVEGSVNSNMTFSWQVVEYY